MSGRVSSARRVAEAGVIAALYASLTLLVLQNPLGFGPIQFRLSEAVTVVALFTPAAVPGLALGVFVANLFMVAQFGPIALLDVAFGTLATLLGAMWTWRFRRRRSLALLGPVVTNALIVPAYLPFVLAGLGFYEIPLLGVDLEGGWVGMYAFGVLAVGLGQAVVVYGLGRPLARVLERARAAPPDTR